jgi:NAD(P)H dehydrogenase (quinone)
MAVALSAVAVLLFYGSAVNAADSTAVSVLVVYHSASGNTEKMAQGVVDGAKAVSGVNVILKRVADVAVNDLASSDAVIVGSPVYFDNM